MKRDSKILWFGISSAIVLGMIYFADVNQFLNALKTADPVPLVPAFILGIVIFGFLSEIWFRFFRNMNVGLSRFETLEIFMAGNFLNSITPLGQFGGEPLMAYIISRNSDSSYEKAFSAVFSGDMMNSLPTITFVIGGGIYLAIFGGLQDTILKIFAAAIVILVVGAFIMYNLWFNSGKIEGLLLGAVEKIVSLIGRGENLVDAVEERLERVEESFKVVGNNPMEILKSAVISHVGFLVQVFCLFFILLSLGYNMDLAPLYFVITLAGLANFSPTPGGSGTYEAAMAGLLTLFSSVPFASALIAAIIFRLTTYWPGIILGYFFLNRIEYGGQ
jgi:uncharacterized protein (TIRG00374 family)